MRIWQAFGVTAVLAALALATAAQAQERRGGFGGRRGGFGGFGGGGGTDLMTLIQAPEVQKALEVTEDEKAYVGLYAEEVRNQNREFFQGFRDGSIPRDQMREKMQEYMRERNAKVKTQLTEIVGKDRAKRLGQIQMQVQGFAAVMRNEDAAGKLDVSEKQKEQYQQAVREVDAEIQKLRRAKQQERLDKILTDSQRSKWKEMIGAPIDFTIRRQPGQGFRGRGRRSGGNRPQRPSS